MKKSKALANRCREVLLNGTWIANTNFKNEIGGLSWQEAVATIGNHNSIAALTFHINYYVAGLIEVLRGNPLSIRDKYSFDLSPITCKEDWENLANTFFENAETFSQLVEALSDETLETPFADVKYGTYQRNIDAMIEHAYYHLGQVVLIKKIIANS